MKNIKEIFEKYDVMVDDNQIEMFEKYFDALIETNKKLNLTAITEENEVLIKHFLDSVLPYKNIPKNSSVVDIGSGAGFPALPLKIIRPDLKIYMVDSLNKRVNFLNSIIDMLKLKNCFAIHSRAEDFAKKNRECFDVAVARAVAPLNTLAEYLLPLVKIDGIAVIYKSSKLDEELQEAKTAIKILGAKQQQVLEFFIDEENIERKILILQKENSTPKIYPRDKNKPRLNPLK